MSTSRPPEIILAGVIPDSAGLAGWVGRNVPAGSTAYIIAERVPRKWLDETERKNDLRFTRRAGEFEAGKFEAGYLFGEGFEIRWETEPEGINVRYVGVDVSEPEPLSLATDQLSSEVETPEIRYQLWGRRVGKKDLALIGQQDAHEPLFASARIPRVLQYPASDKAEIAYLRVREYRDRQSGHTLLWRFAGVEEKP